MSEMTREEALAHFGVKGMRWGVRKDREPKGVKSITYEKGKVVDVRYTKGSYPKTDAERKAFIENFARNTPKKPSALAKNGKQWVQSQTLIGALAVPALIVAAPASAMAAPPAIMYSIINGAAAASVLSTGIFGGKMAKDLYVSKKASHD